MTSGGRTRWRASVRCAERRQHPRRAVTLRLSAGAAARSSPSATAAAAARLRRRSSERRCPLSVSVEEPCGARRHEAAGDGASDAMRLIAEALRDRRPDSSGSKTLPSKKVSLPREVVAGMSAAGDAQRLGRVAPDILAVDLVDQRLDVGRRLELAPADVLGEEPGVVALEGIGRVVAPELHVQVGARGDPAVAVVDVALQAAEDVGRPAR